MFGNCVPCGGMDSKCGRYILATYCVVHSPGGRHVAKGATEMFPWIAELLGDNSTRTQLCCVTTFFGSCVFAGQSLELYMYLRFRFTRKGRCHPALAV